MRPRILLITRNLPPLVGGMERLNWHMAEELARWAEVFIIGPKGSGKDAPSNVTVAEVALKPLWAFLLKAQWHAFKKALSWKPNLILAGSGLTAPLAVLASCLCRARTAVYVHGLDISAPSFIYRLLWLPALRRVDRVIANSHPTSQLAIKAGVEKSRIGVVHPGVALPSVADASQVDAATLWRQQENLVDYKLLLSVGRLTARKGLAAFVAHVLPLIVQQHPDVIFLIVGDAPANALHAQAQSVESIQAAAAAAGVGKHVRFLGPVSDAKLIELYRTVDVHVFPAVEQPGNPEGFGMVAVEAAVHGLPTVAYATGGVVDAVAEGVSGYLLAPGDAKGFSAAVLCLLRNPLSDTMIRSHGAGFAWEHFGLKLQAQLHDLLATQ